MDTDGRGLVAKTARLTDKSNPRIGGLPPQFGAVAVDGARHDLASLICRKVGQAALDVGAPLRNLAFKSRQHFRVLIAIFSGPAKPLDQIRRGKPIARKGRIFNRHVHLLSLRITRRPGREQARHSRIVVTAIAVRANQHRP
ncbi:MULTISPECIES: hypothetical protein [unclassified Nitrobacter]|uniref:hypothetical protein n=1 Tax=unclassified Nitrobacter TaxID=2620411 RepID=UPI0025CC39E1|nr:MULTISPECIES: hypothetical protein [unclassified Nitrobacter]